MTALLTLALVLLALLGLPLFLVILGYVAFEWESIHPVDRWGVPLIGLIVLIVVIVGSDLRAEKVKQDERDYQNQAFQTWFGTELNWKLDGLLAESRDYLMQCYTKATQA